MSKDIKEFIEKEMEMIDRSIVATPTREYLERFANANHGSNDFLLMQLSINFGYKLALMNLQNEVK